MYPIRLGYELARTRIKRLIENGHEPEAVIAIVATAEKTFRRVLKQLIVSAGFESTEADKLLKHFRGFEGVKNVWPRFDPRHRNLPELIGSGEWQSLKAAQNARNGLVHGERALSKERAKELAEAALIALDRGRVKLLEVYDFDGWSRVSVRRRSRLHVDAKVKMDL